MATLLDSMEQLQELNEKLDTIITLLSSINTNSIKAINESLQKEQVEQKPKTNIDRFSLVDALYKNGLPNDKEYIEDLENIITKLELEPTDIEEVFNRLNKYQQENTIKDIKKLSFKFMYNYKQELGTGTYNNTKAYKGTYRKRK